MKLAFLFIFLGNFLTDLPAQRLMIPEEVLMDENTAALQPVFLEPELGFLSGFCPGLGGSLDELDLKQRDEAEQAAYEAGGEEEVEEDLHPGIIVSAILVDKKEEKVIDDKPCEFISSDQKVVAVRSLDEETGRAWFLEALTEGVTNITVKMGAEKTVLRMTVWKRGNEFSFRLASPDDPPETATPPFVPTKAIPMPMPPPRDEK